MNLPKASIDTHPRNHSAIIHCRWSCGLPNRRPARPSGRARHFPARRAGRSWSGRCLGARSTSNLVRPRVADDDRAKKWHSDSSSIDSKLRSKSIFDQSIQSLWWRLFKTLKIDHATAVPRPGGVKGEGAPAGGSWSWVGALSRGARSRCALFQTPRALYMWPAKPLLQPCSASGALFNRTNFEECVHVCLSNQRSRPTPIISTYADRPARPSSRASSSVVGSLPAHTSHSAAPRPMAPAALA